MASNYDILGLKKGATEKEIKSKYRQLAKIHHPDKGGNQATFIKIQAAYEALLKGETGEQEYNPYGGKKTYSKETNFKSKPKRECTYRFEGIKKDEIGYLISFYVKNVSEIGILGKDDNRVGEYHMRGAVGIRNLRVSFETAKKAKYVFKCTLYDESRGYAEKTYKVTPPKKPSVWEQFKKLFK